MRRCSKPLSTEIGSVEECRCKGGKSLSKKMPSSVGFSVRQSSLAGFLSRAVSEDPKRNFSSADLEAMFDRYVSGSSRGSWSGENSSERTRPRLQRNVDSEKSGQSISWRSAELLEAGDVDLDGRVSRWESRARYSLHGKVADRRSMSVGHSSGQRYMRFWTGTHHTGV
jgi:hypothetical protein